MPQPLTPCGHTSFTTCRLCEGPQTPPDWLAPLCPPAGVNEAGSSLAAPSVSGQRVGIPSGSHRSYLWRQVFLTEPVGQWLCVAGHSCRWSIARTDVGVMGRVARRRDSRVAA